MAIQAPIVTHSQQDKMDIKQQLIDVARPHINDEICGFICEKEGDYYYLESRNRSPYPDKFFYISAIDFLRVKQDHNLVGVFHNHSQESEEPSDFDKTISENICYPMVIWSNLSGKFHIFVPKDLDCDVKIVEGLRKQLK